MIISQGCSRRIVYILHYTFSSCDTYILCEVKYIESTFLMIGLCIVPIQYDCLKRSWRIKDNFTAVISSHTLDHLIRRQNRKGPEEAGG